jgi:hypothetical protein
MIYTNPKKTMGDEFTLPLCDRGMDRQRSMSESSGFMEKE